MLYQQETGVSVTINLVRVFIVGRVMIGGKVALSV